MLHLHNIHKSLFHKVLPALLVMSLLISGISGCSNIDKSEQNSPNNLTVSPTTSPLKSDASPTVLPTAVPEEPSFIPVVSLPTSGISLVKDGKTIPIYIDQKGTDYDGISLAASAFTGDVSLVTGQQPELITDSSKLTGTVMIAGSIGNNEIIDTLIADGKLDVSSIKDKWECYKIQVIEKPMDGIDKAIVIAGSDKRGTIYGIYHISEMIGVSPWVYWADVTPKKYEALYLDESALNITSKEPSVKYRGIFLNDEHPSLGSWVQKEFGGFNEKFYDKVFELILRLKGNYLWPAMWSASFSENGVSTKLANAEHADAYGVVMGTSHHEPMFRAGVEWQQKYRDYGSSNLWDFSQNSEAITKFWEDGLIRNKDLESVITIGMRGEADSALVGTDEQNIQLLKDIIITQKKLLKKHNLLEAPLVLTLYKEVEKFWYGTASAEGLRTWDELDDVTIMLTEDNFGNVRTLPTKDERDRKAGWGMYYHFDFHGGPVSYEWINTVPLTKVWEQMSMAYDYGIDEIWIVNVGDLKPMELPISYFLDLAYDFDTWGTSAINKTDDYTKQWVKQQYGAAIDEAAINGIADVLDGYIRLNGKRKPEITYYNTYSITKFNEAQTVLKEAIDLENKAKYYYDLMPEDYKDSYYQLVYFPAAASANIKKMQIFAGLNDFYYKQKSILANTYAALTKECITADTQLQNTYNILMSGGKWKGMMSSNHIGYTHWNDEGWQYPSVKYITPEPDSSMIVSAEGLFNPYRSGTAELPAFTNLNKEAYWLTISNSGNDQFDYNITTSDDWIKVDKTQGSVITVDVISVSIDWDKLSKSKEGIITISSGSSKVEVTVKAELIDTSGLEAMTFVKAHDYVSIEALHTTAIVPKGGVEWKVINNYGRSLSSLKMYPTDISFEKAEDAPYLEYKLYVDEDADYTLTAYTAPTNNLSKNSRLQYAVAFDDEAPITADTLPRDFVAGGSNSWNKAVMDNAVMTLTRHKLTKGAHTLRFYGLDAGLVLQKLVLSKGGGLAYSFLGPQESYYIGKEITQKEAICYKPDTYYTLPGTVFASSMKKGNKSYTAPIIISEKNNYKITVNGVADKDSEITIKAANRSAGLLSWKAGEPFVSTANPVMLEQTNGLLTIEIKSGDVEIDNISIEIIK